MSRCINEDCHARPENDSDREIDATTHFCAACLRAFIMDRLEMVSQSNPHAESMCVLLDHVSVQCFDEALEVENKALAAQYKAMRASMGLSSA